MDQNGKPGDFLRSRRARPRPEGTGAALRGGVRRVPGLRREEVAHLAGVSSEPARAREIARGHLALYVRLPSRTAGFKRLGFTDEDLTDEDFTGGGSDRLVDALVAWGADDAISTRRPRGTRDPAARRVARPRRPHWRHPGRGTPHRARP